MTRPLADLLSAVGAGRLPAGDGAVAVLPQPSPRDAGMLAPGP